MMNRNAMALAAGLLFGAGLTISQMVNPEKVLGFLDVAGAWDPSLAFVMIGALAMTTLSFRVVLRRTNPVLGGPFHLPTARDVDGRLLLGSGLFGVGWGLAGFCPGPALAGLAYGLPQVLVFVGAMVLGMLAWDWLLAPAAASRSDDSLAPSPRSA